jgi:hypothetical protein
MDIKPIALKITQKGRKAILTDNGNLIGEYGSVGLALIAAHQKAAQTFPEEHPERKKYELEIERLKNIK